MKIEVLDTPELLGQRAAALITERLNEAIGRNGSARLILSTGASQFTTLSSLVQQDIDWSKIEIFHLDEYIDIGQDHPASFIKYLKERVASKITPKAFHFVDVTLGVDEIITKLSGLLDEKPVDVGVIGIGENGHIAFNDPPADFDDASCYKIVELDEACRRQQFGEGWFPTLDDVPRRAISMTVTRIMMCRSIISAVPYAVKAKAVFDTLSATEPTPMVPATMLKEHPDVTLFLDKDSASLVGEELLAKNSG